MSGAEFGSLRKELEDPVSLDPLFRAMTCQPCGHNCNEDTLQGIRDRALNEKMQPTCPFCRQVIVSATPNYTIRNLAHKVFDGEKPSKNPPREKESANEEMEEKQKAPVEKKEDDRTLDYLQETASVRTATALSSDREESKAPSECYVSSFDGHPLFDATPELAKNLAQLAASSRATSSTIQRHRKEGEDPQRIGGLSESVAQYETALTWRIAADNDDWSVPWTLPQSVSPAERFNPRERNHFENDSVHQIFCNSSLTLDGTTVADSVEGKSCITATKAHVLGTIVAHGKLTLNDGEYLGPIKAHSEVDAQYATLLSVTGNGNMKFESCNVLQHIHTDGNVTFKYGTVQAITARSIVVTDCTVEYLYAHRQVKITNCKIDTAVSEGLIEIEGSKIRHLACCSNHLVLKDSRVDMMALRLSCAKDSEQILELRNSRVKKVFFKGGHGRVITDAQSSCEEIHQELEKE